MSDGNVWVDNLSDRFLRHFGRPPGVVVRAPGRVNLIGEHTDYNGLPVLPMAVDRAVYTAAAARPDRRIQLVNASPAYSPRSYEISAQVGPFAAGDWGNYHKAAVRGLLRFGLLDDPRGADVLVDADLPSGAGVSSSSAFVVASALGMLALNERPAEPLELAERLAESEQFVGTLSGGMDQAACLLAEAGHALRIDFHPLRARTVPLPEGATFVVCDSLVRAEKSGAAREAYNRRVVECRLACRLLSCELGARLSRPLVRLGDLLALFPKRSLPDFQETIAQALPDRPLRIDEIAERIHTPASDLAREVGATGDGSAAYAIVRRARHVLNEAQRVESAEEALRNGDWTAFGALMDASHASCRDDYEVSCPELDALVSAAKQAGAIGARLTGAGFGGCTVNLVDSDDIALFQTFLERQYYEARPDSGGRHCFIFDASDGARLLRL